MNSKNIAKLFFILPLSIMWIVSNSLVYPTVSSYNSTFFSYGQDINSTESNGLFFGINNAAGLSLIPLMIKEMQNTNATAIPIKQVINATPSNATALQSISKNTTENNNTNASDANNDFNSVNDTAKHLIPFVTSSNATALQNMTRSNTNASDANNDFNSVNDTTKELIPLVVNLTQNTNATDMAMAKTVNATDMAMARTINATPSNATALQNMTRSNTNASGANNDFNSVNDTTKELIPFAVNNDFNSVNDTKELIPLVVNLTQNTNATAIPIKQVINATPSNATALQNMTRSNTNASDANNDFNSVNDTIQ